MTGERAAEGHGHIDCSRSCVIPIGVELVETPPSRHAWGDVICCPFEDCGKTFLLTKVEVARG